MIARKIHDVASLFYTTSGQIWHSAERGRVAALAYVIAAGCVAASLLIHEILTHAFGMTLTAATFYPSVLLSALFGGFLPGLFATGLSIFLLWYVLIPPRFALFPLHETDVVNLIVFAVVNIGIAVLASRYRRLRLWAEAEKRRVEFMLRESTHRVKNILAVIQGISGQIARRTHDIDEFQDAFTERLRSLAHSHDLLVKRNWESVDIRDLVVAQLEPFDNSQRASLEGETVFLGPTATEQLGLALYELGSNSMKYGAWKYGGTVSVSWKVLDDLALNFVWRETGAARQPDSGRKGFGHLVLTEVVPRSLQGQSTLTNNPDGITWRLSIHSRYYQRTPNKPRQERRVSRPDDPVGAG
jgi:two-component sensor histidine kinase